MNARSLLLILMIFSPALLDAADDPPKPTKFKDIVQANFKRWDKDSDGKLSAKEINDLVADQNVKGEEAAAAASIHLYFRWNPNMEPLSKETLLKGTVELPKKEKPAKKNPDTKTTDKKMPEERRDVPPKVHDFQAAYNGCRVHIRKAPRDLFVGSAPTLESMHQGRLGDCYFVSVVGACVQSNPARVKQMFRPRKDDSWEVVFLSGDRVVVRLTDAQIALGSTASAEGLWLNVLEEAFGQVRFARIPDGKRRTEDIAMDVISRGGSPGMSIRLLTGHNVGVIGFKDPKDPAALLEKLRTTLKTAKAGKFLMSCVAPPGKGKLPPGIAGGHVYAVLGYQGKTDKVMVWNPWGNEFKPEKEPPGLENGYPTKNGRFEVPVPEFVKIFVDLEYETNEPAPKDTDKKNTDSDKKKK